MARRGNGSRSRAYNKSLDASGGGASHNLLGAAKGALIRAAASTPPFGGAKPLLERADEILDLEYK